MAGLANDIGAGRLIVCDPFNLPNINDAQLQIVKDMIANRYERENTLLREELAESNGFYDNVQKKVAEMLPVVKALREVARAAEPYSGCEKWSHPDGVPRMCGKCEGCDLAVALSNLDALGVRL